MSTRDTQASLHQHEFSAEGHGYPSGLYGQARLWLEEDWRRVSDSLQGGEERFSGKRILVTGAAGFLGFNFLHFFSYLNRKTSSAPISVAAADNYLRGQPRWIAELVAADPNIQAQRVDITHFSPPDRSEFDFIIHCASVASPMFYRRYPLETIDANVTGLRRVLDLGRYAQSLLYFSSSEIYGDPPAHEIPTKETFFGNVACLGPRACYDESKRLGETLCYVYAKHYDVPVKIVRPFNNYGPGLRLLDGRVMADLSRAVLSEHDIVLHSDGNPTRTFCYSSDALTGYLLALLSSHNGEPFNIGAETPEISMRELADLVASVAGTRARVSYQPSKDSEYLTHNPQRRCPDISKARALLRFIPRVSLQAGVARMLAWYRNFAALEDPVDIDFPNGRT